MNRRTVIRNMVIVSAGTAFFPSCLNGDKKASIALKNYTITGSQEEMLADLTETIIPSGDGHGAKEEKSHLFVLMMLDDCSSKEEQRKFISGLKQFEEATKKRFGSSFIKCSKEQKVQLLKDIENKKEVSEETIAFYNSTKKLTLQSYLSSEHYLTKITGYNILPGHYKGCVSVNNA